MKVKMKTVGGKPKPLSAEEESKILNKLMYGSLEEQMAYYAQNLPFTKDFTVICVNKHEQNDLLEGMRKKINDNNYRLYTPFYDDRIYCLNFEEGARGIAIFAGIEGMVNHVKHDIPVTLDSNITSYIRNYYEFGINTENIKNFIENIRRTSISCRPYVTENLIRPFLYDNPVKMLEAVDKVYNDKDIYNTLFAFEKIFPKKSKRKSKSDKYCHKNIMKTYNYYRRNDYIIDLANRYKIEYICLLKMIVIQMKHKNKKINYKMENFIEFMHKELFSIVLPEINLAYEYFNKGSNLLFFRKVQKNRKGVIDNLKNMAWDIFHLRMTIDEFATFDKIKSDTVIPVFVTYDNDLNEIRKFFQLKSVIIKNDNNWNRPTYYLNRMSKELEKKYSSKEASLSRRFNGKNKTGLVYVKLIKQLEKELNELLYSK